MKSGGFDVIIGNPPYIEYPKVRGTYRLPRVNLLLSQRITSMRSVWKDLVAFCDVQAMFGMIVPTGSWSGGDGFPCGKSTLSRFNSNWFSTYSIRPSKLFDGVDQRFVFVYEIQRDDDRPIIRTTRYHHWNGEERQHF